MSEVLYATTPFPNALLDEAMPHLKDTEWRVLCVIVRQTLGWQSKDSKQRKTSDWLTQTQLLKKTGRDRAALSRAVDVLVQGKYIEVRNERGDLLHSATERRQCKGRLFYSLCAKSEYQAPNSNSHLNKHAAKSEYHRASKANTTKETLTKEIVTKGIHQKSLHRLASETFVGTLEETQDTSVQETLPDGAPEYSLKTQEFISLFGQLYEQMKNHKANIELLESDAKRLEKLLDSRPTLNWSPILQAFFTSDAAYIARRNHSLSAFLDARYIFLMQHLPKHTPKTKSV